MRKPVLAITMGDPGGIGPEVIAKSLRTFRSPASFHTLLIGSRAPFDFLMRQMGLGLSLHPMEKFSDASFRAASGIPFLDVGAPTPRRGSSPFEIGKVSPANAALAYASLKTAADLARRGMVDAVVTAPVNKAAMRLVAKNFHGHTEFLARSSGVTQYAMMFVSDRLKVTLVTIHVPLKKVSRLLKQKSIFEKIRLTDQFLRTYFNLPRPRIAVCALNPHGRETGDEEERVIEPAVLQARRRRMEIAGPLSADRLFHDAYEGRYDAVVSMYHDQGLAPFKMIAFRNGVNVTLGLPYIRTSPDHGTAFDIAYQGKADPSSMTAALRLAGTLLAAPDAHPD